jgi:hypothetical protein
MSGPSSSIADRKALLLARAELDRLRVVVAVHEVRSVVAPGGSLGGRRPLAAIIVQIAAPLFGMTRLARWMRIASVVMIAIRVARDWRHAR